MTRASSVLAESGDAVGTPKLSPTHIGDRKRLRIDADSKSRKRQALQAEYMKKRQLSTLRVKNGSLVGVKVDKRDAARCNPLDIVGVVFDLRHQSGSFQVVCSDGIIGKGNNGRDKRFFSFGDYSILDEDIPLPSSSLKDIQDKIILSTWNGNDHPRISLAKAHQKDVGPSRGEIQRVTTFKSGGLSGGHSGGHFSRSDLLFSGGWTSCPRGYQSVG